MSEHSKRQAAQPGDEPEHTARDEGLAFPAPTQPISTGAAAPHPQSWGVAPTEPAVEPLAEPAVDDVVHRTEDRDRTDGTRHADDPGRTDGTRHTDDPGHLNDPGHLDDHGQRDASLDGVPVRQRRGVRMRTVVFGLVLLVISVSVLVTLLTTARVDATAVTLVILIGAGAALVAGSLAAAVREAQGGPGS